MRREGWFAATLLVGAIGLGVLAGCGGGSSDQTAGTNGTPAHTETPAATTDSAAGGGAAGEISLAIGERVVKERCVLCHGESGKGDGPGGAALNPKPRNWTDHEYMETRTDEQLHESIFNGKGTVMPAWGKSGILTESEIRSAIIKVRTFDPAHKG